MPTRLLLACLLAVGAVRAQEPVTVAERSDYRATAKQADVLAFCDQLARLHPATVRLAELGASGEGRKLPLILVADPPVATAADAAKSGKPVVFAFANIHAGEVDGKEALLMLARDLAGEPKSPILKEFVVALCPNFNPDGNEAIDPRNRTEQNGPIDGVGRRENAAGLDLNRDFVKLESPEVRALVRFLTKWDPAVVVDCHTTNGSYHRYTMTYDCARHPNAGEGVAFARDRLLPEVGRRLEAKSGYKGFYYGNFSRDRAFWETYPAEARYGVQYVGLRNRVAILSESYVYAPYKDRVLATRDFVRLCFEYAAEHKDELKKIVAAKPSPTLALRTRVKPLETPFAILGYEEETKDGKRSPILDKPREYPLRYLGKVEAAEKATVARPYAYLFPPTYKSAVEALQRHGIAVEELREDIELDVEALRVDAIDQDARPFQNHKLISVKTTPRPIARIFPAGTILVRTAQPLGTLAALLLEPSAEDGLTTWNFFDENLGLPGKDAPMLRLPNPVALTAGPVRPLTETRTFDKTISARSFGQGPPITFSGNPVGGMTWLEDGEHYLQDKGGRLLVVEARTGRAKPFNDPALLAKSLGALPSLPPAMARTRARTTSSRMDPKRTGELIEHENDLYFARFDGAPAVRLTKSAGKKDIVTFSPDGRYVAFVRGGNIFTVDTTTPSERALTTDGGTASVLNGRADWVYEEEVFNRSGRAYWWSPDGQHIAYLRFDDSPVAKFAVVNHIPTRLDVEQIPYPKAGDPNPKVSLHVVSAAGGDVSTIDLSNYSPTDALVTRVGWMPSESRVYFSVQNRAQTWLDFCVAPAKGGATTRLFRETTPAWVDDMGEPRFLPDGTFLLTSERSGWKHLYHFSASGQVLRAVTSGPWEVRELHHVDAKAGFAYVSGTLDSPTGVVPYRVRLDGTGVPERLTAAIGTHAASFSPTGSLFIDTTSDSATPTRVRLHSSDGTIVRTLDTNPVYEREEYRFGKYERIKITAPDGFQLEASLTLPPDFDPAKKYPVWFLTYGGPHAPTVNDGWGGGRVYEQALASMGIVVLRGDPRSASGKGAVSTWTSYRKLGEGECRDVSTMITWLTKNHSWADAGRVGMSGHSYGGFLTAYCLTHTKLFSAGIAGAPVTDWRNYDTIYTERYMNTPQENTEGYDATSVVKAARNLHGRLLLLHGLRDDNVHVQNSVQLINELQKADKDFEVMFYPMSRHGIVGRHYQRLSLEFIQRSMGVSGK